MSRGKYQSRRKPFPVLTVVLIAALLIGTCVGGTAAYLSASGGSVTNTFEAASAPIVTVNDNNSVTVSAGYSVYLRAAVTVNWKNGQNVIAASGGDYTLTPGTNWVLHDGFYYYTQPVEPNTATQPIFTLEQTTGVEKSGYTLTADVAVQAIQALGTTDDPEVKAVVDAWRVDPATLPTNPTT